MNTRDPRIVIIGAGVAGIATAYTFQRAGFTNFTIVEKGSDVGGVWHWNRYPGLTCDVPSHIYQFAFAPKPDWSHIWADGNEIQQYHRDVVQQLGLDTYLRLNTEVTALHFNDDSTWTVTTDTDTDTDTDTLTADFVICATGVLHHPAYPDVPGMDAFEGTLVHTARWDPELETSGKRIAVIGTGSTGVQVVSALQPKAGKLLHFTRSPQWMLWAPMKLPQLGAVTTLLHGLPKLHHTIAQYIPLWGSSALVDIVTKPTWRRRLVQEYARLSLRVQIRDPKLRADLTPDYEPLCKRQVLSGTYYSAITAPNAQLVTDRIAEFTPSGIRTADGTEHEIDIAVLATGFQAHNYMRPMRVVGRDGLSLDDAWVKGPRAYRMTAIPGFPNLFTVLGPNSPTGSISLQYTAELTARYIVKWLKRFERGEVDEIEVTEEATDEFNAQVAEAMEPTVWNTGCNSWYFSEDGTIDLWPFDRGTLIRMLSEPEPEHYRVR